MPGLCEPDPGRPFHYRLQALWLDVFQHTWDHPTDVEDLIDDLAGAVGRGELAIYLEDNPNRGRERPIPVGAGTAGDPKDADAPCSSVITALP